MKSENRGLKLENRGLKLEERSVKVEWRGLKLDNRGLKLDRVTSIYTNRQRQRDREPIDLLFGSFCWFN